MVWVTSVIPRCHTHGLREAWLPGCEWLLCRTPFGLNLEGPWAFRGDEEKDPAEIQTGSGAGSEGDPLNGFFWWG